MPNTSRLALNNSSVPDRHGAFGWRGDRWIVRDRANAPHNVLFDTTIYFKTPYLAGISTHYRLKTPANASVCSFILPAFFAAPQHEVGWSAKIDLPEFPIKCGNANADLCLQMCNLRTRE